MPEEQVEKMSENIGKRVRYYLLGFALLLVLTIWSDDLVAVFFDYFIEGKRPDISRKLVSTAAIVASTAAVAVMNFGRDVNFHNFLDRHILKVRRHTGIIIEQQMIDAAESLRARGAEKMAGEVDKVMDLFYHFANEQPVLRNLSFSYWEQYFVNLYAIFLGGISLTTALVYVLFFGSVNILNVTPVILIAFVVGALSLSTRSLIKKIYKLPLQQVREMQASKRDQFRYEVEERFGRD